MKIEFLGTGGAITTPKPGCSCRVCVQARREGVPYSRGGPSVFLHGPDVLVDTPEEIKDQLNRAGIGCVPAGIYSHWHPDHVMGRRVWEALNQDWRNWPPDSKRTDIYLPEQVALDFRKMLGSWDHLAFLERHEVVRLIELSDGESIRIGDVSIFPFRLAEDYVYAFLIEADGKRVLLAPDELNGWEPPEWVRGVDLAVLPKGLDELDPFTGERRIPKEHPILKEEATYEETLEIVEKLDAGRVILSHVEEVDGLSHDDLQELGARLRDEGRDVEFAYDTMEVEV
ncbi:MAG: MBL fold metallo-hydrolase [Rubrobacteraceae bacterium]